MEVLASAGVLISFALLFVVAERLRAAGSSVELTRKMIHVGSGCITLAFPWLFETHWPVLVMTIISTTTLAVVRKVRPLDSLHGVDRTSWGEISFPWGIYLTLFFAHQFNVVHLFPFATAILVFADSSAAVVGKRNSLLPYSVGNETKSLAGSIVFFIVASALMIGAGLSPAYAIAAAASLMLLEAIATRGLDNFVLPLAALLLLTAAPDVQAVKCIVVCSAAFACLLLAGLRGWDSRGLSAASLLLMILTIDGALLLPLLPLLSIGLLSSSRIFAPASLMIGEQG
jgi:phytol kinase